MEKAAILEEHEDLRLTTLAMTENNRAHLTLWENLKKIHSESIRQHIATIQVVRNESSFRIKSLIKETQKNQQEIECLRDSMKVKDEKIESLRTLAAELKKSAEASLSGELFAVGQLRVEEMGVQNERAKNEKLMKGMWSETEEVQTLQKICQELEAQKQHFRAETLAGRLRIQNLEDSILAQV